MVFVRRRKKTLREEVLTSKLAAAEKLDFDLSHVDLNDSSKENDSFSVAGDVEENDPNIFLANPNSSVKGSFLKNKLENPLFKPKSKSKRLSTKSIQSDRSSIKSVASIKSVKSKHRKSSSNLKNVVNAVDFGDSSLERINEQDNEHSDYEHDNDSVSGYENEHENEINDSSSAIELNESNSTDKKVEETETDEEVEEVPKNRKSRILNLSYKGYKRSKSSLTRTKSKSKAKISKKTSKASKKKSTSSSSRSPTYSKYLLDTASKTYRRLHLRKKLSLDNKSTAKKSSEKSKKYKLNLRLKRQEKNISESSNNSNNSNSSSNTSSETEQTEREEIDLLTKYEEKSNEIKNNENAFKLYSENGQPVIVYFNFDYLQINETICFYEDLVSWTHDSKCLRMVYVKNKDTADQERVEIKLFVVDKEYQGKVTPKDLNDLLRRKIAILICDKFKVSMKEAMEMTQKPATDKELLKINEQIDLAGEQSLAKSYVKDII